MIYINIISFAIMVIGIFLILNIDFHTFFNTSYETITSYSSLRNRTSAKDNSIFIKFRNKFKYYEHIFNLYKKGNLYKIFIILSFILAILGIIISLILKNPFLIPGLALLLAFIPIFILDKLTKKWDNDIFLSFENFLSLIYPTYSRTYDIVSSIELNLDHVRNRALKDILSQFVFECTSISPNIKGAIIHLREKLDYESFIDFCDFILDTLNNKSEIDKLSFIVNDIGIVRKNNEKMKNNISGIKLEFYMISSLLILNYPLIYFLNKSWFNILVNTTIGKIYTGIIILFIAISSIFLDVKIKKIELRRNT